MNLILYNLILIFYVSPKLQLCPIIRPCEIMLQISLIIQFPDSRILNLLFLENLLTHIKNSSVIAL